MAALPRKLLTAYCTFFCACRDILLALCCSSCLLEMFSVPMKEVGVLMMVMMLSPTGDVLNTNGRGVMIMMLTMLIPAGELLYANNRGGDVRVQRSGSSYSSCQSAPGGAVETPSSSNSLGQSWMLAWACGGHFLRSFFFNRWV